MPLRQLLYIIFHYKYLIIIPMISAPALTVILLLFVEPTYVSSCKLWVKDHEEGSKLLRIQRPGMQESTFAEVQREIITSSRVIKEVVSEMGLETPPPSQTIIARILKTGQTPEVITNKKEAISEAVRALQGSIWVDIVNPEIIRVSAKMNSSELAQKLLMQLINTYRKEYLQLLTTETTEYRRFLDEQLKELDEVAREREKLLIRFEIAHPEVMGAPGEGKIKRNDTSVGFASRLGDISPIPTILQDLARLEMERNREATKFGETSNPIKKLDEQINRNKALLKKYKKKLSAQTKVAIEHERIRWMLHEARRHYSELSTEYYNILVSQGTKVKQINNIAVLDQPDFNPKPKSPKKKAAVIVGLVLGFLSGLALVYLASLFDRSYHLPEDITRDLDLPVLAVIKHKASTNSTSHKSR